MDITKYRNEFHELAKRFQVLSVIDIDPVDPDYPARFCRFLGARAAQLVSQAIGAGCLGCAHGVRWPVQSSLLWDDLAHWYQTWLRLNQLEESTTDLSIDFAARCKQFSRFCEAIARRLAR